MHLCDFEQSICFIFVMIECDLRMHRNREEEKRSNRHNFMCDIWMLFGAVVCRSIFIALFGFYFVHALEMRESFLDFIAVLAINNGCPERTATKILRKNQPNRSTTRTIAQMPNGITNKSLKANQTTERTSKVHLKCQCMYFYTVRITRMRLLLSPFLFYWFAAGLAGSNR